MADKNKQNKRSLSGLEVKRVHTPDDLAVLLQRAGKTRAQAYLKASGIAARLLGATAPGLAAERSGAS